MAMGVQSSTDLGASLTQAFDALFINDVCPSSQGAFDGARQMFRGPLDVGASALEDFQARLIGAQRRGWA